MNPYIWIILEDVAPSINSAIERIINTNTLLGQIGPNFDGTATLFLGNSFNYYNDRYNDRYDSYENKSQTNYIG